MKTYPRVVDEWTTLRAVVSGQSIARYGDGEIRLALGAKENISQVNSPALQNELRYILRNPIANCLVAIPAMDPKSPKWWFWQKYEQRTLPLLSEHMTYYSQFITRPDSAPDINTKEFFDLMQTLWEGQRVTLVGNGVRSLTPAFMMNTGASELDFVTCRYRDAYTQIDWLELECVRLKNKRVLLCAGATATCLAYRLARKGLHAIDMGHIGMFWRQYDKPKKSQNADKTT